MPCPVNCVLPISNARGKGHPRETPPASACRASVDDYQDRLANLQDEIDRFETTLVTQNAVIANTVKSQHAL
jgi:hypothetical protein